MTTSSCQLDFRKVVCGLKFPIPSKTTELSFLFGDLYMPSYPSYEICQNFLNSCHDFLEIAPLLSIDCNLTYNNLHLFPKNTQTIVTITIGTNDYLLQSPPNEMKNITLQLNTECPYALAVPDDPTLDNINWIPGFGCAMACPFRCYTDDEMILFYNFLSFTQFFTFISTFLALYNHCYLSIQSKKNLYFIITLINMLFISLIYIIVIHGNGTNWQSITCYNNTVFRSIKLTIQSIDQFLCNFFAFYYLITYNLFFWIFIVMTLELMCRIIFEIKNINSYRKIYMSICGLLMILLTFIQLFIMPEGDITVNGSIDYTCKWQSNNSNFNYFYNSIPYLIIYLIGTFITIWFIYVLIKTSLKVNQNNINSIFKNYRTLLISCYLFIGIFPLTLLFIQPYYSYFKSDTLVNSSVKWVTCLIINFKSSNSNEYLNICGNYPEIRYPVVLPYIMWSIFYIFTPICNIYISYTNEIQNIYKEKFHFIFKYLPFLEKMKKISNKITPVELNSKEKNHSNQSTNELIPIDSLHYNKHNYVSSNKYTVIEVKKENVEV